MSDSSYQIKPLESSNYATWSTDVRFLLHEKNCFKIVAGKETAPYSKEENRRELKDFNIRQRLALSILYLNISTEYRSIIENVTDPVEAWKLLRDNFRPDNRSYHLKLFGEFFQCRIQPNEKLNIFSSRLKRICDQLEEMGKHMEETYQCYQLLKSLPSKFDSIVQNILRWTDETFKYKDVLLEVIAEETRIDFRDGLSLQRNQHEMFSVQKSKIKCHYCGKFGHFRRECRNGTAASSGTSNRRFRTYRKGPELRQHPCVSSPIGSSVTSDEFNYNAFRGGRRDRNYSFKDRNDLSRYHGSANSVVHQNQGKSKLSFFLAEANLSCNVSKDAWIVDTAASNHFTNNRNLFINFVNVVNENMVLAINGVEFPIEGKGDVKIWFNDHECLLKNVFFSRNKQIFKANLEQELYYAYPDIEPKYASSIEKSVKIKGKPNDLMIWHERFGHANVDYILKTSRLNAVRGLPKIKKPFDFECEPCRLNKYKRVSFQSIECTRSKAPLNLLHCDVWGPANVIGKRGEKYYLSVLDDYSRRMFIFPMCHKSDTYDILAKFIIRAERQLDLKVKAVRTDFGGEFIASILSDFFVERGIKHEKTNIYTPQQNGASERLNRTVIDGARTVLSESGLDKSFWPEVVLYFVHVWNRLCHSGQTLTPIELYIGIKPSIRHQRHFGSTLYVGTPRPLRGKLDPKAKKGILVGFALGTRGYRV
ncbi:copia protein [Trichonephila clavipes]|uniref:Copia protein n=1 Tax=Trichonephila clavipes TaxID=2585209 RepID=A0A8X6R820_TRICX|nr:copia protein [Trichonephila clavipes]